MKNFEEFKTRFQNGEFDEYFKEVSSPEDVVELAEKLGYDVSFDDIASTELDEDKLELVAGGKNDNTYVTEHKNEIHGNGNTQITF